MRWCLKWRKELESGQYYDLLNRGFIKPEDYEPNITGLDFYFDAFRELSTSRPVGMDIQAIPFTAIVEYFRIYELEDFDEFLYIIRLMDNEFMKVNRESNKNEGDASASKNRNKANNNNRRHKGKPRT